MQGIMSMLTLRITDPGLVSMTPERKYIQMVIESAREMAVAKHRQITKITWQVYYWQGIERLFGES